MPVAVGVPLIVIVLPAQAAIKPGGKFVGVPMPVALVVVWVTFVGITTFATSVWDGIDDRRSKSKLRASLRSTTDVDVGVVVVDDKRRRASPFAS